MGGSRFDSENGFPFLHQIKPVARDRFQISRIGLEQINFARLAGKQHLLFVALRLGVAIALVVAVTVEIAANPHGMGYALMLAQQSLDPALMLAWLGWIGAVGYAINVGALALQRWAARRMGGTLA